MLVIASRKRSASSSAASSLPKVAAVGDRRNKSPLAVDMAARLGEFYLDRKCYAMGLTHPILALEYNDLRSRLSDWRLDPHLLVHLLQPYLTLPCGRYVPGKVDLRNLPLEIRESVDITDIAGLTQPDLAAHFTICRDEGIRAHTPQHADHNDKTGNERFVTLRIDGQIADCRSLSFGGAEGWRTARICPLPGRPGSPMVYARGDCMFVMNDNDDDTGRSFRKVEYPKIRYFGEISRVFRNNDSTKFTVFASQGAGPHVMDIDGKLCPEDYPHRNPEPCSKGGWIDPRGYDRYILLGAGLCGWGLHGNIPPTACETPPPLFKAYKDQFLDIEAHGAMDGAGRFIYYSENKFEITDVDNDKSIAIVRLPLPPLPPTTSRVTEYSVHVDAMGRIVVFLRCGQRKAYRYGVHLIY